MERFSKRSGGFSDTSKGGLNRRMVSEIHSSKGETGLAEAAVRWRPAMRVGGGLHQRASAGDPSSLGGAAGTREGNKLLRKESGGV